MSTSSDSEDNELSHPSRLGECEVCGSKEAIYTCPKCEVKTCNLECVRIHKKELECDGTRDRTKFIYMKDFTDTDLHSDYRLLEECARFVYAVKRDEKKRFTRIDKDLPIHLHKLRLAARQRGTILQFLAQNFTRHKVNTTKYIYKTNQIQWRVEWVFPNVETKPLKFVEERCPEKTKLSEMLDKFLNPNAPAFEGSKDLMYYKSAGFSGVKVLLKAEKLKGSAKKYFELDTTDSLAENLSGKCVVEFPIIFVVLKDHAYNFEIVTPEDDFDCLKANKEKVDVKKEENIHISKLNGKITMSSPVNENTSHSKTTSENTEVLRSFVQPYNDGSHRKRQKILLTEKIAEEKKLEIQKEIKEAKKKRPKNLLFTTGYSSEESISDSGDENDSIT